MVVKMLQTRPGNHYDKRFGRYIEGGSAPESAAVSVLEDYLDGKPRKVGISSAADRCQELWVSRILHDLPDAAMQTEEFVLTLTEYFRQDEFTGGDALMVEFASKSGAMVLRAARYSGILVKRPATPWHLAGARFSSASGICSRYWAPTRRTCRSFAPETSVPESTCSTPARNPRA
jgi:hypothetical protein